MKIALITGRFPALSETFVLNQITGLLDCGHEVDIFAGEIEPEMKRHPEVDAYGLLERTTYFAAFPESWGPRILKAVRLGAGQLPRRPGTVFRALNVYAYGRFAGSLRPLYAAAAFPAGEKTYDIIHCHFGLNGILGLYLRDTGLLRGKLVTSFHGADLSVALRHYGRSLYNRLLAEGDLFLPISERWRKVLIDLGAPPDRTRVQRMGIDFSDFEVARPREHSGVIRLISVCRLVEKKGIEFALKALATLPSATWRWHYGIVGDGPLLKELETLSLELGIADRVSFHGVMDRAEVMRLLPRADIFVQPSVTARNGDQEGIPVALMEAMAAGLPVVSTYHSGIPELVTNEVSGLLVGERDVHGLGQALESLITRRDLRGALGRKGREDVMKAHNVADLNNQLEKMYAALLDGRDITAESGCERSAA